MDGLYKFRDHYFEEHNIEQAVQKNSDVEAKLKETLEVLDKQQGEEGRVHNSQTFIDVRFLPVNGSMYFVWFSLYCR